MLYSFRFAPPGNAQSLWRQRLGIWLLSLSADDARLAEFLLGPD